MTLKGSLSLSSCTDAVSQSFNLISTMLFRLSQDQTPAAELSAGGAGEAESGGGRPAAGDFLPGPLEGAASVPQLKWS